MRYILRDISLLDKTQFSLWDTRRQFKDTETQNPNWKNNTTNWWPKTLQKAPKSSKKLQKAPKSSLATEPVTSVLCMRALSHGSQLENLLETQHVVPLVPLSIVLWSHSKQIKKSNFEAHLDHVSSYH
jgi:hypothetical protein